MTFGIMAKSTRNVASYVLSRMGVGKSLIILLTSFLLVGCGSTQDLVYNSHSTYASTTSDYSSTGSMMNIASNYYKWNVGRMNKYDRKQQEQAVFYALNRLAPGETTEWFTKNASNWMQNSTAWWSDAAKQASAPSASSSRASSPRSSSRKPATASSSASMARAKKKPATASVSK